MASGMRAGRAQPEVLGAGHTHLLARVDRYDLAIPIASIVSIHEAPAVFPLPCAQPGIAGGIQFQGMAVPVFDLRRSLRLQPRPIEYSDRLVLIEVDVRIIAPVSYTHLTLPTICSV